MNYHPHLHTIVLGGGLDAANTWKDKGKKFFFPVKVMILSILVYTFFTRMFDFMLPLVVKYSIVAA